MPTCPSCGEELEDGLCAMCLLAGGAATEPAADMETMAGISPQAVALEYDGYGPYRIVQPIGEGGMGTVYLAEQTAPIQRQVALKVIKPGMDTGEVLARFQYERQALALMDHPNIAHVFDASATEKGRPYFVMEYIDGAPITTYCDRKRMNTRERLALFLPVCQALQHAHQKGVLHRDIKPSNVLVTEVDGVPTPKIIDFGIAKATDLRNAQNTAFTQLGQMVGTPEYMSPEAADVMTNDVDTASDVYSLGVLLYELLVGAVPFDSRQLRKAGLVELMRIIREEEAPRMTAKLTQMGAKATAVAENRRTDLSSLKRQITGDLNWIVTKAVEKSRQRRYGTVAELWADIDRHLTHRPVKASPPSRWYLTTKFVRRNRAAVVGAAAVTAALFLGLGATLHQARQASLGRAAAEQQRDRAETAVRLAEQKQAEALAATAKAEANLADVRALANTVIFDVDDKVKNLPGVTPVRESLVRLGLQYLDKAAAAGGDQRGLGSAYLHMADLQGNEVLRDTDGARENYRRSIKLLEAKLAANPKDWETSRNLALAHWGLGQSDPLEASGLPGETGNEDYRIAAGILREALKDHPAEPSLWLTLAKVQGSLGLAEEALASASRGATLPKATTAERLARIAVVAEVARKWLQFTEAGRALPVVEAALADLEKCKAEQPGAVEHEFHEQRLKGMLGESLSLLNRAVEGTKFQFEALEIASRLAKRDRDNASYQFWYAQQEEKVGQLESRKGNRNGAIDHLQKAMAVQRDQRQRFPGNSVFAYELSATYVSLAAQYAQTARWDQAKHFQTLAADQFAEIHKRRPQSPLALIASANAKAFLGDILAKSGDRKTAVAMYDAADKMQRTLQIGSADPAVRLFWGNIQRQLAQFKESLGRTEEALSLRRSVLANALDGLRGNPNSPLHISIYAQSAADLAQAHNRRQEFAEGLQSILPSRTLLETTYTKNSSYAFGMALWQCLFNLRFLYARTGEYENGLEAARRSLQITEDLLRRDPNSLPMLSNRSSSYINLSSNYEWAGRRAESLAATARNIELVSALDTSKWPARDKLLIVNAHLFAARKFDSLLDAESGIPIAQKALSTAESISKLDPENRELRGKVIESFDILSTLHLKAGNLLATEAARNAATAVRRETNPTTLQQWSVLARRETYEASLHLRAGRHDEARAGYLKGASAFAALEAKAQEAIASVPADLQAWTEMYNAHRWRFLIEQILGNNSRATAALEQSLRAIEYLARQEPNTRIHREHLDETRRQLTRMKLAPDTVSQLLSRQFQRDPATEAVTADSVRMWSELAEMLTSIGAHPVHRRVLLSHATAISRRLVAAQPVPSHRALLASHLEKLATHLVFESRWLPPIPRAEKLREAHAAAREAVQLFTALHAAKQIPLQHAPDRGRAQIVLSAVEVLLQREQSTISQK